MQCMSSSRELKLGKICTQRPLVATVYIYNDFAAPLANDNHPFHSEC